MTGGVDGVFTDALRSQGMATDPTTFHWLTWRTDERYICAQVGLVPSDDDVVIGKMDTSRLAREAVNAHNAILREVQGAGPGSVETGTDKTKTASRKCRALWRGQTEGALAVKRPVEEAG